VPCGTDKEGIAMSESKQREIIERIESNISAIEAQTAIQVFLNKLNEPEEYDPKKGKILVVENQVSMRESIIEYLRSAGYVNFITVSGGVQGIDATYRYLPDIIICGDNMSDMKGNVFHETIARNPDFKRIPFVFIMSIVDNDIEIDSLRGATAYLSKPIRKDKLVDIVDVLLVRYMELKEIIGNTSIDELTGTHNKTSLEEMFGRFLAVRKLRPVSVVCVTVDDVGVINEKYGHPAGDEAVALTGKIIQRNIRVYDFVGRYKWDMFIIVLPDTTRAQAVIAATKLGALIRKSCVECDGHKFGITASFGVVSLVDDDRRISVALGMESLAALYNIDGGPEVDWDAVDGIKLSLVEILISLSRKAMRHAGEIRCGHCEFTSEDADDFPNGNCPECGATDLAGGGDSVAVLPDC
jgi:diguanylate cyclase (GGDEF)-like protein